MDEMLRCAQRGWDILLRAAVPLLVGGLVWAGLNLITAGLLTGPALVGLFVVALKSHRRQPTDVADILAAFPRVAPPLLAGIVFVVPFKLSAFLASESHGVPVALTVFLAAWFAVFVHVFPALADAPEQGLAAAVRRAWEVAERGERGRALGLALHLAYGVAAYLLICLGAALPGIGGLMQVLTLPAAACLLAAWYSHAPLPATPPAAERGEEPERGEDEAPSPGSRSRKKTPSRRPTAGEADPDDRD